MEPSLPKASLDYESRTDFRVRRPPDSAKQMSGRELLMWLAVFALLGGGGCVAFNLLAALFFRPFGFGGM